jgi:hypothetical protein
MSEYCEHIYKNMGQDICPKCERYTHETNWLYQSQLHKQWHADGKATYGGWWSI